MLDRNGLNQQDRYVILHTTIKAVLNMVPTDFQDFRVGTETLDILQPVENLDCQTESDFYLEKP